MTETSQAVSLCLRCGASHRGVFCPRCGLGRGGVQAALGLVPHVVAGALVAALGVPMEFVALGMILQRGHSHDPFARIMIIVATAFVKGAPVLYAALGGALAARIPAGLRAPGRALVGLAIGVLAFAYMISWTGPNVQHMFDDDLAPLLAPASAVAAIVGAVWGAPMLDATARELPFRWFAPLMAKLPWPARIAVLVPVATLAFAAGVSAAMLFVALVCAIIAIVAILGALFGSRSSTTTYVRRSAPREEGREAGQKPLISLPPGARVADDGRIVQRDGWFTERPTGMRIDAEGRIVQEGMLFDAPTGVKIDAEGRIVQEGMLFDAPTGARLKDGELVREGMLFDEASGVALDRDGRVVSKGILADEETGVEIFADGRIRRRDGDES